MEEENGGGNPIKREKTAAEIRKSNKPLMERKRRERINNCLDQLKAILMDVTKKESSYYSKLEKADILEMTVKYLKNMKRQQLAVVASDPTVITKYIAGFNECTTEVTKYLNSEGLNTDVRTRLLNHLANSLQRSSVSLATTSATASLQLSMGGAGGAMAGGLVVSGGGPSGTSVGLGTGGVQSVGQQVPVATQLSTLPGSAGLCMLSPGGTPVQTLSASPMQLVPAKLPSGETVFLLTNPQALSAQTGCVPIVSALHNANNINNYNNNINVNADNNNNTMAGAMVTIAPQGGALSPQGASAQPTTLAAGSSKTTHAHFQFSAPAAFSQSSASSQGMVGSPNHDTSSSESESASPNERVAADRHGNRREMPERVVLRRESDERCRPLSDSSDSDDSDVANNNDDEEQGPRGPMWRPW